MGDRIKDGHSNQAALTKQALFLTNRKFYLNIACRVVLQWSLQVVHTDIQSSGRGFYQKRLASEVQSEQKAKSEGRHLKQSASVGRLKCQKEFLFPLFSPVSQLFIAFKYFGFVGQSSQQEKIQLGLISKVHLHSAYSEHSSKKRLNWLIRALRSLIEGTA